MLLRVALGLGGAATRNDLTPEIELSGAAGFFSIDLGGTVSSGAAVHVRLSAHALVDPTVSINGAELGELTNTSLSYALLGAGLTYYFPSNFYLTGVIGIAGATLEVGGVEYESETGVGLAGDIGYELPVGGDWGLGFGGRLELYSIPDGEDRLGAAALGLLVTVTYH